MAKATSTATVVAPAPLPARPVRYAPTAWGPQDVITVNVPNPKIGKSQMRYALYSNGMTVAQYKQLVFDARLGPKTLAGQDLRWDVARGFITITPAGK